MVTLLIMSNGRYSYLKRALGTLDKLHGNISRIILNDDSERNSGYTLAMILAWEKLKQDSNEWVFHLEEDFLIREDIYLNNMIEVLSKNTHIKQMVLLRQPLAARHIRKGGIIQAHPDRYEDKTDGFNCWVEHRVGFSCNPCLYSKSLIHEYSWPNVKGSEGAYGNLLLQDPKARFAYWGKTTDAPKVEHIGEVRTGFGY